MDEHNLQRMFGIIEACVSVHFRDAPIEKYPSTPRNGPIDYALPSTNLTQRESEILDLIIEGNNAATIANHLNISEGTVKVHRRNAYAKLEIHSLQELFRLARTGHLSATALVGGPAQA